MSGRGLAVAFVLVAYVTSCGSRTGLFDNVGVTTGGGLMLCGNGRVDPGEACDDGNRDDDDQCRNNCGPVTCGDGTVQPPETCDDRNANDTDDCLSSCVRAVCGDGYVRAGIEECDDGNTNDRDGCDAKCKLSICGDGRVSAGEECDLGPDNGDRPAFLVTQPGGVRFGTNPLVRAKTAVSFYDFSSASSHTGFEEVGESRIYLYVDSGTGRLSLVLTHGIDQDSSGMMQPRSDVEMDVTGLPPGVDVELADDNASEFFSVAPGVATGRWAFGGNSDGGLLGFFPFPGTWKVVVTPRFLLGITSWGWVTHTLQRTPLAMTEPITIEAFAAGTACRKDCTVPRCGDGILDGGEVCDDGNTIDGDGCSATCTSLR